MEPRITIEWDAGDRIYVARYVGVPAFDGYATHGDTPEEAIRQLVGLLAWDIADRWEERIGN